MRLWAVCIVLFLSSCASKSHWKLSHMHSGNTQFNSSRLCYIASDPLNSIDLELLSTHTALSLFLNVHSHPIAPYKENTKQAYLVLKIAEISIPYIVFRHEGGHRLLLPIELQEKIIHALLHNQTVYIETSGYLAKFEPQDFSEKYRKMQHPPRFSNPFRLPF